MWLTCSLCSKNCFFFFYLTLGYFLRTPDNSNLFSISLESSSYRESTVSSYSAWVMIRVRWIAISFVMWQRCFPRIGIFSFLNWECIHEGRLRNKMRLHSTLKRCFFVLKDFDPSQELKTIAKKSLQFYMFPT